MGDLVTGLSGLQVAQRAIEIIGNNIANAATEGYHKQEPILVPVPGDSTRPYGQGVTIRSTERMMEFLLDSEIRRQQPILGQVSQELSTLQALEAILGDLDSEGLGTALDGFFSGMRELASLPDSPALREQAVWAADSLASQFNALGNSFLQLEEQVLREAQTLTDQVNALAHQVADLNLRIRNQSINGMVDSNLQDIRDQAVMDLAELADINVTRGEHDTLNIQAWSTVIVHAASVTELEAGYTDGDRTIGISTKGAAFYETQFRGGRIGGLMALQNEILPAVSNQIDQMAAEIADRVNALHVQGTGVDGSFSDLTGWAVSDAALAEWDAPVVDGTLHLRVTDTATGAVTRHKIVIDADTDTLTTVAAKLDALAHVSASPAGSRLQIQADTGYTFDFMPALVGEPATSTLTGTAAPMLSGLYQGAANQTLTFTMSGSGTVGVTPNLALEVRDGSGTLLRTLAIGLGYAAGDRLEVGDGVYVSLSSGTVATGETFTAEALANSDPTGFLAAAGVNAFFAGRTATSLRVADPIKASPRRIATTLGEGDLDNVNITRIAALADTPVASFDNATLADTHRRIVSNVGQWVQVRKARQDAVGDVVMQLGIARDDISGVDINEEAAKLLIFERMFQGMAKYMQTIERARMSLLEVV